MNLSRKWQRRFEELAHEFGVRAKARVVDCASITAPTVIGWIKPIVLLPTRLFTGFTDEQIVALLAHELAHVARRDYFVNIVQSIVEALLFYHPVVWWVSQGIREEREYCCDDRAVAATHDGLSSARALTALETWRGAQPHLGVSTLGGSLMNRIRRMVGKSADNGAPNRPLQTLATALAACTLGVSAYGFASYTSPADGQGCSCKCHGKATTRRPGAAVDGYYWDTRTPAPSQGVTTEPAPEPSSGYFFLEESTKAPANVYYYDASTGEPEGSFYFDATTTTPEGDFYFDARTGDPEGNIYFEDVTEAPSGGVFTWMESNGEPSSGFFFDETEGSGDHQTDIWYVDPNSNHQAPPHPKHPEALDHPHSGGVYEWIEAEAHEHDGTSGSAPAKRNTTFRIRESHGHGGPATDPRHDNSQGSRRYGINTRDEVRGGRRSPFRQATPPEAEPHPPHAPRRIRLHTNTAAPTTPGAHSAPHAPGGFFLRSGKPATPGAPPAPAVPPSSKAHAKSWHQAYNKLNLNPRTDHPAPSGAKNSNPFFRVRTTQPHPEVHENAPPVLRYWSTNAGPGNAHGNNHQEAPAPKTAPGQWLRNRYVPLAEPHRVHQSEPHGEPHAEHRPEPLNYDARSRGRNSQPRRVRVVPGRRAAPQAIADPDLHRRGSAFDPADPKVPGRRVHEVHKAHKAHEVHEAHKAHEAHKVHEVHNAHEAHKDTQVIM